MIGWMDECLQMNMWMGGISSHYGHHQEVSFGWIYITIIIIIIIHKYIVCMKLLVVVLLSLVLPQLWCILF